MGFWIDYALEYINLGLMLGLILGALLLIRLLTKRFLTPQQRVVLWMTGWIPAYVPPWYMATNWLNILPVTFRSLLVPRTGWADETPAFLPSAYEGPGDYNLALPGGELLRIRLEDWNVAALVLLWICGVLFLWWYSARRDRRLRSTARRGLLLSWEDPLLQGIPELDPETTVVRLCRDLPSSFVRFGRESRKVKCRYAIYLQAELPTERLRLILLHEAKHIGLHHCLWKCYANAGLILYWWNPLVWLGYRYFCRDLELACDRAALQDLESGQRRIYARTLVELGSGRQLWESPLSFGECDADLRVRAAVDFRPMPQLWTWREFLAVAVTFALLLFFVGGPGKVHRPQDLLLAYQRGGRGTDAFLQAVGEAVSGLGGDPLAGVDQVWFGKTPPEAGFVEVGGPEDCVFVLSGGCWYLMELRWNGQEVPRLSRNMDGPYPGTPDLTDFERII